MPPTDLTSEAWSDFYRSVVEPLGAPNLDIADEHKPGCNDEPDDIGDVPTIVSRFWSNESVEDLSYFVNPEHWDELGSLYWQAMTPIAGPYRTADGGYTATFNEVVRLPTGTISVDLDVTYRVGKGFALTEYRETGARGDVEFDRGYVLATDQTVSPSQNATLVYSTKSIVFTDPMLNTFTDLACDNGWVDLMIRMAIPEGRRGVARGVPSQDVPFDAGSLGRDDLDQWAIAAHKLVNRNVVVTRTTLRALQQGQWNDRLVDDLLSIGTDAVETATIGARAWRDILAKLSR